VSGEFCGSSLLLKLCSKIASSSAMAKTRLINYSLRSLTPTDQPFLWEMLDLARYVQDWGQEGDRGFLASDLATGEPIAAVWLRFLIGENQGYGYIDDQTPELGLAVVPEYRGQGIGTALLNALVAVVPGAISLSVSADNPALRLYQRFGFAIVSERHGTMLLCRSI
jgi:ribosomal protein S18 acetylase RimI-like enzyme